MLHIGEISSNEFIESINKNGGGLIGLIYYQYLLILLLIIAVLMDFRYDRIYNGWIILGILLGISLRILGKGLPGIYGAIAAMLLSFCILYPIYKIGALGAGDVKLLVMVGSFVSAGRSLRIIAFSFIIGSVFSIVKMISEENFRERMQYLFSYLADVLCSRQWKLYGENLKDDYKKYKSSKIHFALPICISVMLGLGGLF